MVRVIKSVELMNKGMTKTDERMRDYEKTHQVFNDMCEDVMSDRRATGAAVKSIYDKVKRPEADQHTLNETNLKLNETVIDLHCRSMRDNLIFTGIEKPDYRVEQQGDTEHVLCEFLKYEMNIEPNSPFHRVHRLGYNQRYSDYPHPIVAKFEHFKDRELVRLAASFGQKRIKPNSHQQNTINKQWFNKECRDAYNAYNYVRRLYNKYKTNHYKHLLKT